MLLRGGVPVDSFVRLPFGANALVVMSTASIAAENAQALERIRMGFVQAGDDLQPAGGGPAAGAPQRRKAQGHSYSNTAMNQVLLRTAGPNRKRGAEGGTMKDEGSLMGMVAHFFSSAGSIRTLVKTADNLAMMAQDVRAELAPRQNCVSRRTVRTTKPLNATGYVSRYTLTQAIQAVQMALDWYVVSNKLVEKADLICFNYDMSFFGTHDLLGSVLDMFFIEDDGKDAAGHLRHKVVRRSKGCSCLPTASKKCLDVRGLDGSLMKKEVPYNLALSLGMSGNLLTVMNHPCAFVGSDRGPETVGGGRGKDWAHKRKAFLGKGSVLESLFVTRESAEEVMQGEHGDLLHEVMDLFGIPADQRVFSRRSPGDRLDTSGPILRCEFKIRILRRKFRPDTKAWVIHSDTAEIVPGGKESVGEDPLSRYPGYQGVSSCSVWCGKHAINRAGVGYSKQDIVPMNRSFVITSCWRTVQNFVRLEHNTACVLGLKGARKANKLQEAVRKQLGEKTVERYKAAYSRGLRRQKKGVECRWNSGYETMRDVAHDRKLFAPLMVISFAEGTEEAKIAAVEAVCSEKGFEDCNTIRFPSARLGTCFYGLTRPDLMLHVAIMGYLYTMAWQPTLAASADHKECSSSAMESMLRSVKFVLLRGSFMCPSSSLLSLQSRIRAECDRDASWRTRLQTISMGKYMLAMPKDTAASESAKESRPWKVIFRLGHRGTAEYAPQEEAWISTRLERIPEGWSRTDSPPALLHLYGKHFVPPMASAASSLRETMVELCRRDGDILSDRHKEKYQLPTDTFLEKYRAAQWLFYREASRTVDWIFSKCLHVLLDPLVIFAKIYDFHQVALLSACCSDFELDAPEESSLFVDIATDEAIAYAKLLLLQTRELKGRHGDDLHLYVPEPLKSLYANELPDLERFARAEQLDMKTIGVVSPKETWAGRPRDYFPKPVTAFQNLSRLALMARTRTTNNNNVESRWSLLTQRYHAHVRHATALYWTSVYRQKDFENMGLGALLQNDRFLEMVGSVRQFRRRHASAIHAVHRARQEEAEERIICSTQPRDRYETTNIKETGGRPTKRGKSDVERRKAGKTMSRGEDYCASESEESASSEESEQLESDYIASSELSDTEDDSDASQNADDGESGAPADSAEDFDVDEQESGQQGSSDQDRSIDQPPEDCDLGREKDAGPRVAQGEAATSDAGHPGDPDHSPAQGSGEQSPRPQKDAHGNDSDESDLASDVEREADKPCKGRPSCSRGDGAEQGERMQSGDGPGTTAVQARAGEEALAKHHGVVTNPLPGDQSKLTEETAKTASVWKVSYLCYLLEKNPWKETSVEECSSGGRSGKGGRNVTLTLTRLDGVKFPLKSGQTFILYILFGDRGLELIDVTHLNKKVPDEALDHGRESHSREEWCVTYNRVLDTAKAAMECKSDNDFRIQDAHGRQSTSWGARTLDQCLQDQKKAAMKAPVFHRGDFPFEALAKNVVGFVAWDSLPTGMAQRDPEDSKFWFTRVQAALYMPGTRKSVLKDNKIKDVDWGFLSGDFSEPAAGRDVSISSPSLRRKGGRL